MAQDGGSIEVPESMKLATAALIDAQQSRKRASQDRMKTSPVVEPTILLDPEVAAFKKRRRQSKEAARFSRGRDVENTVIGSRRTDWNG